MAILGQYLAAEAINTTSIESLQKEFDELFEQARNRYMLTEADLSSNLDEKALTEKQGAKERSVFNFTVARFGLLRFKRLVDSIFGAAASSLSSSATWMKPSTPACPTCSRPRKPSGPRCSTRSPP
jgi:hypothetical protein